jgi:hypothetical protein
MSPATENALHLQEQEQEELQQIINRHSTPQQIAQVVLAAHSSFKFKKQQSIQT